MRALASQAERRMRTRGTSRHPPAQSPGGGGARQLLQPRPVQITDPQGWGTGTFPATGQEGYLKYFNESDIADSVKVSTTHELTLPIIKDVVIGVGDSHRTKFDEQAPTGYLVNADGQPKDPLPPLVGITNLDGSATSARSTGLHRASSTVGSSRTCTNPNPGTFVGTTTTFRRPSSGRS